MQTIIGDPLDKSTYQIETGSWAVLVNIDHKLTPKQVEQLATEYQREQITSGHKGIHAEGFANFINNKFGANLAYPSLRHCAGKFLIFV